MKKIIFIALFSLVIMGSFAAKTGKATEKGTTKYKTELSGHLSLKKATVSNVTFLLADRTYATSCGTWTVTGTGTTTTQEQSFCDQACANGWSTWHWDGTTLTQ